MRIAQGAAGLENQKDRPLARLLRQKRQRQREREGKRCRVQLLALMFSLLSFSPSPPSSSELSETFSHTATPDHVHKFCRSALPPNRAQHPVLALPVRTHRTFVTHQPTNASGMRGANPHPPPQKKKNKQKMKTQRCTYICAYAYVNHLSIDM